MSKLITITLLVLLVLTVPCAAASPDSNAMAAVALFIDTSGHYVPGIDFINKALNEVIRFKINALFLGSEVQSGDEVLRDLRRCNVDTIGAATPEALASYAGIRHVNNIILLSVRPLDIALDLKAYSTATSDFFVDKTIARPDGSEAMSTIDALSGMVGSTVSEVLETVKNTVAAPPVSSSN